MDGIDMRHPLAHFLSPARLALSMSRDPGRWERHVDRLFGRLAGQLRSKKFTWGTSVRYLPGYVSRDFAGAQSNVRSLTVGFREFRGAHYSAVRSALARHGLEARPCAAGDPAQGLWIHLADDPGVPVTGSPVA
ncbi:hypothetical protein [Streptomyces sp. NPDC006134]|uniref:hypothetical protein n=1 Tax=Streptomyces sp. NPDC006134 TaxID=3154467 RepID=UPI00340D8A02